MLSKIATVTLFTAVAAQYVDHTTVAVEVTAAPADLYYADYDNIVEVANQGIYYQSALTPEAVDRLKLDKAKAAEWSAPVLAVNPDLYDAKGVAFCGEKGAAMGDNQWGGKYTQIFVADAGQ